MFVSPRFAEDLASELSGYALYGGNKENLTGTRNSLKSSLNEVENMKARIEVKD